MKIDFYISEKDDQFYWFIVVYGYNRSASHGPFGSQEAAIKDAELYFSEILNRPVTVDAI